MATGEDLARAIQTLAKGTQVAYDKTVQMTVSKVEDVELGKYRVSMEGNSNIPAIAIEGLRGKLSVGDKVLVKIPNSSLSSISDTTTNLIECKLRSSSSKDTNALDELRNSYYDSGTRISDIYTYTGGEYAIIAGNDDTRLFRWNESTQEYEVVNNSGIITVEQQAAANRIFQMYASSYRYVRLSAKFKTAFNNTHTTGVYGLKAIFKDAENNEREYLLSFDAFVGTPYSYTFFNTQEVIFDLSADNLQSLERFEFFDTGFVPDRSPNTIPNIFMKDFNIQFVDRPEIEPDSYYLYIQTPHGTVLDGSRVTQVELQGRLIYNANVLLDANVPATLDDCQCFWYKENPSVTIASPKYDKLAGYGWELIKTGPGNTYQNTASIIVHDSDITNSCRYKLIVIYKEDITSTAFVTIARYNDLYSLSLRAKAEGASIWLELFNGEETGVLTGNWYVSLPGGSYNQIGSRVSKIDIASYKIYGYANFTCQAFDGSNNSLGTLTYFFDPSTFVAEDDNTVFTNFIGTDLYHYDANGQITVAEAERERSLVVEVYTTSGSLPSENIKWYWKNNDGADVLINQNGTDLSSYDTMFTSARVDSTTNILYYKIRKTFRENFKQNSFKVEITDIDGNVYEFTKDITFIKDGDQGTNGTGYSFTIAPFIIKNNERQYAVGTTAIAGTSGQAPAQQRGIYLTPRVYSEDRELAESEFTCAWTKCDNLTISSSGHTRDSIYITLSGSFPNLSTLNNDDSNLEYWVRATITIGSQGSPAAIITAYYPVDLITLPSSIDAEKLDISTLLSYVKYTAAGFNPEYQNNIINITYDGVSRPLVGWGSSSANEVKLLNPQLLSLASDYTRIYPTREFNYYKQTGSHNGLVLLKLMNNTYLLHSVFMYLNTYGNEAINGWDGTQLELDENGQYILAPMIGAGKKESDNTFTGVVMGTHKGGNTDLNNNTGLYGYQHGVASFGLMEDGKAFFGKANTGGRIWIDGSVGTISGGNVTTSGGNITPGTKGMYLRLANDSVLNTTKAIGIGWDSMKNKEKFYIQYDGTMYANGATVSGDVHANGFYLGDSQVLYTTDSDGIIHTNLAVDAAHIDGTLDTNVIFAAYGDVVNLTVDSLKTSRRITNYLRHLPGDDNYISIHEEKIHYISGECDSSQTEQAADIYGNLLYWERSIAGLPLNSKGYPYDPNTGMQVAIQDTATSYPVYTYKYTDTTKAAFDFVQDPVTQYYEPQLIMGGGYGIVESPDRGKGFIKREGGNGQDGGSFDFFLLNSAGKNLGMSIGNLYTDIYGLRKTTQLNFTDWNSGSFTETVDGDIVDVYTVQFDGSNRPILITDGAGHSTEIVWGAAPAEIEE